MTRWMAARGGRALLVSVLALVPAGPATVVGQGWRHAQPLGRAFWFPTGPMVSPQAYATATLLPTGQVLLAGGDNFGGGNETAVAELYNPYTDTWTPTGRLTFPTEQATATLLRTGKVLVVGGASQFVATTQADLYNPATGTFIDTGYMDIVRVDHTATLLRDGRVLVAGGCNGTFFGCRNTWNTAEVYNPTTGTFTDTGSMSTARQYATATLLPTGQVLIVGGVPCLGCYPLASAELYNPATGTFTLTGSLHVARGLHTATLLPNGQVLVAGGCSSIPGSCYPADDALDSAELYNPATGTWRLTGRLTVPRADATATLLPNGQVLIAGGVNDGGSSTGNPLASAELYTPATGTFTATAAMSMARDIHTATLLPYGGVLVASGCLEIGGHCNPPVLRSAEVYWYGGLRTSAQARRARRRP